ncbi:TIGR04255 family protein [Qipengyuania sp. 6B39]|nr:TIGR04255 family protein [Qipengyuania proteolytica]
MFVLAFSRNFSGSEIDRVVERHDLWRLDLPKLMRPQVFQFSFLPESGEEAAPPPPVAPVAFQSFKRDGSIDWQLKIEGNSVSVNCLSYSRWNVVSRQAKNLLEKLLGLVLDQDNKMQSVTLQYIDTFVWSGDESEYDVEALFNRNSGFFPDKFRPSGKLWHFHQGEFAGCEGSNLPQRILQRIHLDAVVLEGRPIVRVDTTLRAEFSGGVEGSIEAVRSTTHQTLELLHSKNKELLSLVITDDLQQRISLNRES